MIDNSPESAIDDSPKSPIKKLEVPAKMDVENKENNMNSASSILEKKTKKEPQPGDSDYVPKPGKSIFIAMPAFDERDCHRTVFDAYGKAENPDRIFFGNLRWILSWNFYLVCQEKTSF